MKLQNMQKILTLLGILAIIVVYTIIKIPYFDHNFTGEHPMKYSAYVEPAIYMVEEKNPFHYQQKYRADPVKNPEGIVDGTVIVNDGERERLPQFPILQWMIAGMLKYSPNLSVEMNTRIVMHVIGVVTLIFAFLFVKEYTNRTISFIFTLLLATNPIFGFSTFVTVYDSFNLMILFISLFLLSRYLKNPKYFHYLAISGIIAGLGVAAKESLLLWILPIALILTFYESFSSFKKIFNFGSYLLFLLIPYAVTRYTVPNLNQNTRENLIILGLSFLFLLLLSFFLPKIKPLLEKLHKKKLFIPLIILALIPVGIFSFQLFYRPNLVEEFITDLNIFANMDMYIFMARQFVRHLGIPLAIAGIIGTLVVLFTKDKDIKMLGISFLAGGIVFLLVAAKSIFFHDYYTVFLMAVILLNASILLFFVFDKINHLQINIFLFILLLIFAVYPRVVSTQEILSTQEEKFDKALEYFIENTEEHEFYIDEVQATYFSLYSGRPRVRDLVMLEDKKFKQDVKELGFKEAMDKYRIKYLITFNEEPEYERFANIFSEEELLRPSYRRSDLILSMVRPEEYEYFEDMEERERIIEEYNLKEKFVFEKQIGNFRFFTFAD